MAKKIQMMSHDKEWQMVDGVETLVPVEQFDIDPVTDSSCVKIEGFRTLEETLSEKNMFTPEVNATKVMDKVGGEYHQSVVDGAYEEAILYGNTQVNLCEEDSSNALQIPTTFTSFNNSELQINNKENQVVAPLIKGVTMVNLAQTNSVSLASSESVTIENVKGNTLYTLSFKFTTKNTNSGVTIESYNGDTYLENTMHKTGLGDVVKFTFTTHANATKIHICNNAAYGGETIQLDEIMLIEGDQTALDIPFFKGMKSVELVRPLTNLFTNDLNYNNASATSTNNNGTVTVTASSNRSWASTQYILTNLKAHTNYLVMWDNVSTTQTSTTSTNILICVVQVSNNVNLGGMDNNSLNPTKRCIMFNTGDIPLTDIALRVHATLGNTEAGTTTVTGLRVFEYDDYLRSVDLQSIGWFSGTKNVAAEPIKTSSKNLYPYGDVNFTPTSTGWFDAKGNGKMYGDIAQKSQSRFLLKKGTYYLSMGEGTNITSVQLVDDKEKILSYTPLVLKQDTYLTIRVGTTQPNVATTLSNIQIERGATATDYVAHDSRYYEPNGQDTIVLRSLPSGVCDTFNLQTGEYTRRIGEVVLNGSEEWRLNKPLGDGSFNQFVVNRVQAKKVIGQLVACDKLISDSNENKNNVIWIYDGTTIVIHSSCTSKDEFKTWLQQNPLTVQYEFREPTTAIIPRTIKRNNNGTVSTVDFGTYTNKVNFRLPKNPSYLTINSMTSIKPVVEPITYVDFKTRLKANTDYSVIMDKNSTDKTINLGGTSKTYADKMLVRTPSVNLGQNLRISGGGSIKNIMVIEGDVLNKELPYFNGMCNVKMPIVRNCGKNLFDGTYIEGFVANGNNYTVSYDTDVTSILVNVNKNTDYILSAKTSFNRSLVGGSLEPISIGTKTTNLNAERISNTIKFNSGEYTNIIIYLNSSKIDIEDIQVEEGITATSYEPYRGNDICLAQGEIGLSQDMFEQGGMSYPTLSDNMIIRTYEQCKENNSTRLRSKTIFKINGGKTYKLTLNDSTKRFQWYLWGQDGKNLGVTGGWSNTSNTFIVTVPQEAAYMSLMFKKTNESTITVNELNLKYFQLLELDSTVQLRSLPNGVKDELNLLTGEYIQRVGEVVLDGSNDEGWYWLVIEPSGLGRMLLTLPSSINSSIICDKIRVVGYHGSWNNTYECCSIASDSQNFILYLTNVVSESEFRNKLQSNPITVQYELAEPIISYPRIVSNTQEREVGIKLPNGVCDTYNPSTGIRVQRVGKVILDGSEKYARDGSSTKPTDLERFSTPIGDMVSTPYNTGNFVVETSGYNIVNNDKTSPRKLPNVWNYYQANIYLDFATTAFGMSTNDSVDTKISKLKTYLSSNPITVYYELANPIVTTDIVLPNGVHDEYNPLTGLYTKRVGFIEFDGSNDERWSPQLGTGNDTHCYASISIDGTISPQMKHMATHDEVYIMSNAFETVSRSNYSYDREQLYVWSVRTVYLNILQSKLSTVDINGLRQYLSQNPIKLWYELQTPITYQLTPYFGLPMPYAYKDGYLIMDSAYEGQTLPAEIKYKLLANRTGQITQNNIKLQNHTSKLSNLEAMLVEATLQSMYEREMMVFNLEMVNINLINLEE